MSPLQQTPEGHGSQELREAVASRLGLSSLASKPAASQAAQQAEARAVLEPLLPDPGAAAVIEIRDPSARGEPWSQCHWPSETSSYCASDPRRSAGRTSCSTASEQAG